MAQKMYRETENKETDTPYLSHCPLPTDPSVPSLVCPDSVIAKCVGKKGCEREDVGLQLGVGGEWKVLERSPRRSQLSPQMLQHGALCSSDAVAVQTHHLLCLPPVTITLGRQAPHFARSEMASGARSPSLAYF